MQASKLERIARYWNGLADVYDESGLLAGATYPAIVRKIQGEFRTRDRLLEIGAGTGMLTIHVAPLVAHVTCTDVAPG
jgi:ubiquinone/menaquinone biosynthesis C-methylase UbiE